MCVDLVEKQAEQEHNQTESPERKSFILVSTLLNTLHVQRYKWHLLTCHNNLQQATFDPCLSQIRFDFLSCSILTETVGHFDSSSAQPQHFRFYSKF